MKERVVASNAEAKHELQDTGDAVGDTGEALDPKRIFRVAGEAEFADELLLENVVKGGLILEYTLADLNADELEEQFIELMARDLEDRRAVRYASRVLREVARREPKRGVELLHALSPAEKEKLVPALAKGWAASEPAAAIAWIETAWIDEQGEYIDRSLQNHLYIEAMDTIMGELRNYEFAIAALNEVIDPQLKRELTEMVARRVVADGPENALDRLALSGSDMLDLSIMDAIAEEWAARDGMGAMNWTLLNQTELSPSGVRSIAKQLVLNRNMDSVVGFHQGLESVVRKDSVAAEVARLNARRNPVESANWVLAIVDENARSDAVYDALYEIGYENFNRSIDYIDYVYAVKEPQRAPILYSTLKDWLVVDLEAVVGYLGSGRSNLTTEMSQDLLHSVEGYL